MTIQRFELHREVDPSGISGTGKVTEGVIFSDGTCAMRWLSAHRSTAVYDSVDDLMAIHGHNGATVLVVHDNPDGSSADYDGAMADLAELIRLARAHVAERRAVDDTTAFVELAAHLDLNYPEPRP